MFKDDGRDSNCGSLLSLPADGSHPQYFLLLDCCLAHMKLVSAVKKTKICVIKCSNSKFHRILWYVIFDVISCGSHHIHVENKLNTLCSVNKSMATTTTLSSRRATCTASSLRH